VLALVTAKKETIQKDAAFIFTSSARLKGRGIQSERDICRHLQAVGHGVGHGVGRVASHAPRGLSRIGSTFLAASA
jgi:hypothetical protein